MLQDLSQQPLLAVPPLLPLAATPLLLLAVPLLLLLAVRLLLLAVPPLLPLAVRLLLLLLALLALPRLQQLARCPQGWPLLLAQRRVLQCLPWLVREKGRDGVEEGRLLLL